MQEIESLCDAVTVMRNGTDVGVVSPKTTPMDDIISMIIARDVGDMFPSHDVKLGPPRPEVRNLSREGSFSDVSLSVRSGEVVGLTGLLGSGAKELVQCLFGLHQADSGNVSVDGKRASLASPMDAVGSGIAMLPEDRRAHGVALGLSVRENVSLASLTRYSHAGFMRGGEERSAVSDFIREPSIKTPGGDALACNLSGGNQQKVAIAKWLSCQSKVYVLDEPTVAVDVAAKIEIYTLLNRLASEGAALRADHGRHAAVRAVHRMPRQRFPVAERIELLGERRTRRADSAGRRNDGLRPQTGEPTMSTTPAHAGAQSRHFSRPGRFAANYNSLIVMFVLICVVFSLVTDTFLSPSNLFNVLVNNVVLLAIVALGLTLVVSSGGINLSVGMAVDLASMVFVMLLGTGHGVAASIAAGLGVAVFVGLLNAVLITRLKISPFLATLGVLFIGQSTQQFATGGGQPIYLITGEPAAAFDSIARSALLHVPTPVIVLVLCRVAVYPLLHRSVFGRQIVALGLQPGVACQLLWVYVACALLAGIKGILLSATVKSYVPLSGNAFLLDAIGATFIGTTLSSERRPSVIGTLIGVLMFAAMKNGLLLVGWNFYWQQVGIGVLVFIVLAASFALRRRSH
ncbi:MAG: ABC transporter, permease protein 2 KPN_00638 [uncultured Paraburkholderia sp.]|nr:MAG: ABC transporter, permease protein 2 KPN_00638 [uncultured Paraburkholderia sp.]CAH2941331.1 MAG: ABC transporter, permease protein 2 KPN_00638 [uncultured Paraburkholderia sp.]